MLSFGTLFSLATVCMGAKSCGKNPSFWGSFARERSSFQLFLHARYGERVRVFFLVYMHGRKQPLTDKVTPRFWSSDTQHFWPRQEGAVFDFSRPRPRIAFLLGSIHVISVFLLSVGGAWLGKTIPQSIEIVACVCRSCCVKLVFKANNELSFSRRKYREIAS